MRHRNPNNAIVYTNAFKNSFPGLQFENLAKKKKKEKVKASDIFLESQSRNGIFHRILMNASQIVKRRSDDAFSSSLFDELCDDSVEKFVIGDSSNDDRS